MGLIYNQASDQYEQVGGQTQPRPIYEISELQEITKREWLYFFYNHYFCT